MTQLSNPDPKKKNSLVKYEDKKTSIKNLFIIKNKIQGPIEVFQEIQGPKYTSEKYCILLAIDTSYLLFNIVN